MPGIVSNRIAAPAIALRAQPGLRLPCLHSQRALRRLRKTETGAGSVARCAGVGTRGDTQVTSWGSGPPATRTPPAARGEPAVRREPRSVNRKLLDRHSALLRQRQHQHAIRILCLGLGLVDRIAQTKAPAPAAIVAFAAQDGFPLALLLFVFHFRADRDFVAVDGDMDILLLDTGNFGLEIERLVVLAQVYLHLGLGRHGAEERRPRQVEELIHAPERIEAYERAEWIKTG